PCRIDRRLVAGGCRGDHLCRRLRHRRHRDELRNAGVALPQSIFRQRHLYLGRADLDGADRAHGGPFFRPQARPPPPPPPRAPSPPVLALTVLIGSLYLLAFPSFAQAILEFVLAGVDDIRAGSLISSLALMFFPVTFLGMYSPFAIRLLLRSAQRSGRVSGAV